MKTITLGYPVYVSTKIDIDKLSPQSKKWLEIWFMEEEDRTDEQWDFLDNGPGFHGIIEEATGYPVSGFEEINIEGYEE